MCRVIAAVPPLLDELLELLELLELELPAPELLELELLELELLLLELLEDESELPLPPPHAARKPLSRNAPNRTGYFFMLSPREIS